MGASSAQKDVREELPPSWASLKLCFISGAVLRHLTCIISLHLLYYPETVAEDEIEV